ncbi:MAG TPA: hypothetical protein VKL61_08490, partial [Candidatus Polarisedimenticolia bacterium]|nr:hypothetical protein [Candidatus Polarisedimenticolia bacterium]
NLSFQLAARHTRTGLTLRWPAEYLGSQFLLASPLLFPLLVVALAVETRRAWREKDLATLSLALPADGFLLFFALASLWTSSAPHWSAPGIVCGALVTARWALRRWSTWSPARRLYSGAALLSGFLLVLGAHSLLLFYDRIPRGLRYDRRISSDAVSNAFGWPALVQHLRTLEGHDFDPRRDALVCDSYTAASLIAFYSAGRYDPLLMATAGGRHGLAYLYWQNPRLYVDRPGIYVGDGKKKPTREAFEQAYGRVTNLGDFRAVAGRGGGNWGRSQTWRILRGERLSSDPGSLTPFGPDARRRSGGRLASGIHASRPSEEALVP